MARYLTYLRGQGASARKLAGVCSFLGPAGHLVLVHDAPTCADRALACFSKPPWPDEFRRQFMDSDSRVARYCRTLEKFARFLAGEGLIEADEE
jgi:hypothetical protein